MRSPESTPEGTDGEYSLDQDNQLPEEDTLVDRGLADNLDEGYSPPEKPLGLDEHVNESLDERLAREEPDFGAEDDRAGVRPDAGGSATPSSGTSDEEDEVGELRSGRLVASERDSLDEGGDALSAYDAGIDGGAASAEEAAVHVLDDE
jgi:hypothetical protein